MRTLIATLLLLTTISAGAATPEDGIYANPAEPGRGWVIESQGDVMAVSTYTYAADGSATWYLSTGRYDPGTMRFSGQLNATRNGQCIGCPYVPPTPGASGGALTIEFDNGVSGTLTQNGQRVPIMRTLFGYGTANDLFRGAWAFTGHVGFGISDGEFIVTTGNFTSSDGTDYVKFERIHSTVGLGLVRALPDEGYAIAILDSSTSYYKTYLFDMTTRNMQGEWWLHKKTDLPSGDGEFFWGSRMLGSNEIPSKAADTVDRAMHDDELARRMQRTGKMHSLLARHFPDIEAAFEQMRSAIDSTAH